jgi:hypothetical protein
MVMRRLIAALGALLVLVGPATAAAAQQTSTTPSGVPVREARIGESVVSRINSASPRTSGALGAEVWRFDGQFGQSVEIVMRSAELDAALLLFDNPGLAPRIAQDDDSAGGRDARLRVVLPRTGTYYVAAVAGIQGAPQGLYSLDIAPCGSERPRDPSIGPDGRPWRARY